MWGCCEPMRTLGRPPRPLRRALSHPQWNPALGRCWQDSCGPHPIWNQSVCVNISNTFITFTYQIDVLENMQDKLLMLFKFWWGLCLLMCIFVLIYHIHFTVKFSYTPISHILVISNAWFSSVRTSVQFGPPRGQLLLRLLLKLVSDSNCLENGSRILVILLFINLAADL